MVPYLLKFKKTLCVNQRWTAGLAVGVCGGVLPRPSGCPPFVCVARCKKITEKNFIFLFAIYFFYFPTLSRSPLSRGGGAVRSACAPSVRAGCRGSRACASLSVSGRTTCACILFRFLAVLSLVPSVVQLRKVRKVHLVYVCFCSVLAPCVSPPLPLGLGGIMRRGYKRGVKRQQNRYCFLYAVLPAARGSMLLCLCVL